MRVTKKQLLILRAITKGDAYGNFPDIDQVLANLDYQTSKQSFQFSLRALIKNGWVERGILRKRAGQERRLLKLTLAGYHLVNAHSNDTRNIDALSAADDLLLP